MKQMDKEIAYKTNDLALFFFVGQASIRIQDGSAAITMLRRETQYTTKIDIQTEIDRNTVHIFAYTYIKLQKRLLYVLKHLERKSEIWQLLYISNRKGGKKSPKPLFYPPGNYSNISHLRKF